MGHAAPYHLATSIAVEVQVARPIRPIGVVLAVLACACPALVGQTVREIRVLDSNVSPYYFSPPVAGTATFTARIEVPVNIPGMVRGQSGGNRQDGSRLILRTLVDLVDAQGSVIRQVMGEQVIQPLDRAPGGGRQTVVVTGIASWDGRRADTSAAPDGRYTFRLSAELRQEQQNQNANPRSQGGQPRVTVVARTTAPAQGDLVLDATPPQISLAPASGTDVTDLLAMQFIASYSDATSGVVPATFHYRWNTGELTDLFAVGAAQAIYRPTAANVPRLLALVVVGTNAVRSDIVDRAGNVGRGSADYQIRPADSGSPVDEVPPSIELIAGDRQRTPAGRCLPDAIQVRVTSSTNGQPWAGELVEVRIDPDNGGVVVPDNGRGMRTASDGTLSFHLRSPRTPGPYTAKISVQGWFAPAAEISFESLAVSVRNEREQGGNYREYPSSALPSRVDLRLEDADGQPVPRAMVVGRIVTGSGQQLSERDARRYGEFLPPEHVTNDEGRASFAFVLASAPPEMVFSLRFELPEFFVSGGPRLTLDVPASVRDPVDRLGIVFSGQAFTNDPALGQPVPMTFQVFLDRVGGNPDAVTVVFENQEPGAQMTMILGRDPQEVTISPGIKRLFMRPTANGRAGINYSPVSTDRPELVNVGVLPAIAADVFAVGKPWVRVVERQLDSTYARLEMIRPGLDLDLLTGQTSYTPASRFFLEERVPHDAAPLPPTLQTLDACGEIAATRELALAAQEGTSAMTTRLSSEDAGDVYLSDAFLATQSLRYRGESTRQTGPEGERLLQLLAGSGFAYRVRPYHLFVTDFEVLPRLLLAAPMGTSATDAQGAAVPNPLPAGIGGVIQVGDALHLLRDPVQQITFTRHDEPGFPTNSTGVIGFGASIQRSPTDTEVPITVANAPTPPEGAGIRADVRDSGHPERGNLSEVVVVTPPQLFIATVYGETENDLVKTIQFDEEGRADRDLAASEKILAGAYRAFIHPADNVYGMRFHPSSIALAWVIKNRHSIPTRDANGDLQAGDPDFINGHPAWPITYAEVLNADDFKALDPVRHGPDANGWDPDQAVMLGLQGMRDWAETRIHGNAAKAVSQRTKMYLQVTQDVAMVYSNMFPDPTGGCVSYFSPTTSQVTSIQDFIAAPPANETNDQFLNRILGVNFVTFDVQIVLFRNASKFVFVRRYPAGDARRIVVLPDIALPPR